MGVEAKHDEHVQSWVNKNDKLDKGNKHKEDGAECSNIWTPRVNKF